MGFRRSAVTPLLQHGEPWYAVSLRACVRCYYDAKAEKHMNLITMQYTRLNPVFQYDWVAGRWRNVDWLLLGNYE